MSATAAEPRLAPGSVSYRWLVTFTGTLAAFTMVLSGTVVNVAVPDVMGAFGVGQDRAQFLATAYITTMTASQLLNAWFVGAFGQRNAFFLVLAVFMAGSVLCAVSPNLDLVILGRILQGFAAGIVQPLAMVTIFQVFPPERRGTAIGIYSMGLVLALGLGPVVGGITVDALGWRYIFLAPLPLVGLATLLATVAIPEGRERGAPPAFDWTGYGLLCLALFCLMSGIAGGQRESWSSTYIVSLFVVGTLATVGFMRSQLRSGAALLPLDLFANPRFAVAVLLTFIYGIGNFATTYVVPVYGQLVMGYPPTLAGFILLPAALAVVAIFPLTGPLADRVAPRLPILGGLLLFSLGTFLLGGTDVHTAFWSLAGFAVVARLGMGLITPPLMTCALRSAPSERLHHASGTINFFRQLGGAFGINGLVAFLEVRTGFHADTLAATQDGARATTRELLQGLTELLRRGAVPEGLLDVYALRHLGAMVQAQAETRAFQDGYLVIAAVFLLALVPAWVLGRAR